MDKPTRTAKQFSPANLTRARSAKGYTRQDLAGQSGVPVRSLCDYEGGVSVPSFDAVCKIAFALGNRLDYFTEDAHE